TLHLTPWWQRHKIIDRASRTLPRQSQSIWKRLRGRALFRQHRSFDSACSDCGTGAPVSKCLSIPKWRRFQVAENLSEPFPLRDEPDAFRRFLPYRFACGAIEAYFTRQENYRTNTVENLDLATRPDLHSNPIEQELITRDLLEKISEYPLLQRSVSKTLECIR